MGPTWISNEKPERTHVFYCTNLRRVSRVRAAQNRDAKKPFLLLAFSTTTKTLPNTKKRGQGVIRAARAAVLRLPAARLARAATAGRRRGGGPRPPAELHLQRAQPLGVVLLHGAEHHLERRQHVAHLRAIQKGTRVLISLWDSLMWRRVSTAGTTATQ